MITLTPGQDIPPLPPMPDPTVIVPGPEMLPPWLVLPPEAMAVITLGFFAATAFVLYPLMRAVGRRIEGRSTAGDPAMLAELEQLRHRVADLEAMQHRMAELEERVDFSERLLSQQREGNRLPGAR
jgi:hypothetical protein